MSDSSPALKCGVSLAFFYKLRIKAIIFLHFYYSFFLLLMPSSIDILIFNKAIFHFNEIYVKDYHFLDILGYFFYD
jgi:hypothetical protein